jgi:hypothetical protein
LADAVGTAADLSQAFEPWSQLARPLPVAFGVKTAAEAAFGEIPRFFAGWTLFVTGDRGLKDGESTFRKRLALNSRKLTQKPITHALRTFLFVG